MLFVRLTAWCVVVVALAVALSQLAGTLPESPATDLAAVQLRYRDQLCWRGACAGDDITDIRNNLSALPQSFVEISSNADQTCWRIIGSPAFIQVCAAIISDAVRINWITLTADKSLRLGDLLDAFGPPVNIIQNCNIGERLVFANGVQADVDNAVAISPGGRAPGIPASYFGTAVLSPLRQGSSVVLILELTPRRTAQVSCD